VEVIGHGRAIPTPVGDGDQLPTPASRIDSIDSGMEVLEYDGGGMNVVVNDGIYRIDDTLYTYTTGITGYTVMDDPAPMVMGGGLVMGWGDTITPITIPAAPSVGYGRYDMISIGIDGVVDVTSGTAVVLTSEPSKPSPTSGHVLIGYLFIYGGMTSIPNDAIGVEWTAPIPNTGSYTSSIYTNGEFEFLWDIADNHPEEGITVSLTDQYGVARSVSTTATIKLLVGTGGIGTGAGGGFGTTDEIDVACSSQMTFYYERNQLAAPEVVPVIQMEFAGFPALTQVIVITLLNSSGEPIG
jgi:hypothetical protein